MSTAWLHVLVPAYGPSPYLAETLSSVLAAGDDAMVVTVVDDGSPASEVAEAAREAGPKVEYVRLSENRGVSGAFQACAEHSRGRYTVIMGSDDLMDPTCLGVLQGLVARFEEPAIVTPSVTVVDGDGDRVNPLPDRVKALLAPRGGTPRLLMGDSLVAGLLTGNWLYFPALAWRSDVLRRYGFRQDMQTALDLDLELRILFDGGTLAWSPEPAFRYRRHGASVSSRSAASGERFDEERRLYAWAAVEARSRGWRRSERAARLRATSRLNQLLGRAARLRSRGSALG